MGHRDATPHRVHEFRFVEKPGGRQWAECSCGWASPDIIGRETAVAFHERHVKKEATRS